MEDEKKLDENLLTDDETQKVSGGKDEKMKSEMERWKVPQDSNKLQYDLQS